MSNVELSNKLYEQSTESEQIITMLIESTKFPEFDHLKFAKIKCLFKDKLEGHGWNKLGKIVKVNDLYWSLLDLDIIVIINKDIWKNLEANDKVALVSHLLSKVKVYWKYEGKKKKTLRKPINNEIASYDVTFTGRINYTIVPPDIEEFETVANKFPNSYGKLKDITHATED